MYVQVADSAMKLAPEETRPRWPPWPLFSASGLATLVPPWFLTGMRRHHHVPARDDNDDVRIKDDFCISASASTGVSIQRLLQSNRSSQGAATVPGTLHS